MGALSASDILNVWERGQDQHPIDRALTLMKAGYPESTWEELVELSVGQRDARLLALRECTLGSRLEAFTQCPQCGAQLEFVLSTADLSPLDADRADQADQRLAMDGFQVTYRSPNSRDLAAIAGCDSPDSGAEFLLRRCISQAAHGGEEYPVENLPADIVTAVKDRIAANNAAAELELDLHCTECGHQWPMLFDIVSFFWEELVTQAKRLVGNVHTLARAYGWCESDILSMSARRRQLYLEMVT